MNVPQALETLERLRVRLGACSLVASFDTRHGMVEVTASAAGPKILVAGQEVPHRQEAS